ncbi:extracellular solute-binding protein family 1 [Chloroherpeton thalassium ATCC 35110]|uniref:Extracellular solute-binding protein family 1 n=1 Tax=Chloroherpeton thalassium (strain ATCC 35110 / GB-78) TaxID=517418 RepID=B3QYH0_CHLT3|nr:extracellular solute-binding protein [Chloroherpeton thalassium]ACF13598.1 extracellular solute-binding protein family 1 [Chloroherpeton thalassium ATCC 35110]
MTRRISLLVAMLLSLAVFGCSGKQKEAVVVYSPHGKEMLSYFEKAFEKAHPETDVIWLDMGSQTVLDSIRTEKENPQADVWWGGPKELFETGEKLGLLVPYKPAWANEVAAEFKSASDFWYAPFQTPECIMFNSELLTKADAPQDWDELLAEKWHKKIIIRNPVQSGTMRTIFAALVAKELRRTGSLDSGYAWLKKLDKNTKSYAADPTQLYLKLSRGEALLTLWNLTDVLLQSRENNYPFGFVIPKSGTVSAIEGIGLVAGARHPKAAKLFYDFVTNRESLALQAEKFYRLPTRQDLNLEIDWMQGVTVTRLDINDSTASANQHDWMDYWQKHIRGK